MFKCKQYGQKFKTPQALGGHTQNVHSEKPGNVKAQPKKSKRGTQSTPATTPEEPSEAEQIRAYAQQGFTLEELTTELGFKPSTVRQEMAKLVIEAKAAAGETGEKSQTLPIVLKDGKGEVLSPEAVYYKLVGEDGVEGERDFKALMKWSAAIELVQRMTQIRKSEAEAFAETVKPMLDMMEKSRQELDAAAARARDSSVQIAEVAAASAAARAAAHIDSKFEELKQEKKDIATVQKPMQGLMARTMETMMHRLMGMAFGGGKGIQGEVPPTPGLIDKREQGEE